MTHTIITLCGGIIVEETIEVSRPIPAFPEVDAARTLLDELGNYDRAVAMDMEEDWLAAKYLDDMADYDERNGIDGGLS